MSNDSTIPDPRYIVGDAPQTAPPSDCNVHVISTLHPRNVESELRRACAEMLLAGSLMLADVQRALGQWDAAHPVKQSEERFRKALEAGREALS